VPKVLIPSRSESRFAGEDEKEAFL